MKAFLQELAEEIYQSQADLSQVTVEGVVPSLGNVEGDPPSLMLPSFPPPALPVPGPPLALQPAIRMPTSSGIRILLFVCIAFIKVLRCK